MDDAQLNYFRQILESRLEALLLQSGLALTELVSENLQEIEYLDQVSTDSDRVMKLRIKSRESHLIKKIRNALERIENKTFGLCEACGDEISIRRLEARPVATKCIVCKTEEERQEKMAG